MKKKIFLGAGLLLITILAIICALFVSKPSHTVMFEGYTIKTPKGWTTRPNGKFYTAKGEEAGTYFFVNEDVTCDDLEDYACYSGFEEAKEAKHISKKGAVIQNAFLTPKGKVTQFYFEELPNPEPYAVSLCFYQDVVNSNMAKKIAKTFTAPELGEHPPEKHITLPEFDTSDDGITKKTARKDDTVGVKNVGALDGFIKHLEHKEPAGVHIISYAEDENGENVFEEWFYVESSGGKGYLYTYYLGEDGTYTYKNNPTIFGGIVKEISEETGTTSYRLRLNKNDTARLFEIPVDLYRDHADVLVSLKSDDITEETIFKILEQGKPGGALEGLEVTIKDGIVTLKPKNLEQFDRETFFKDAAVIFTLAENVKQVVVEGPKGEKYVLSREEVLKAVGETAETATDSPEDFINFTEQIEYVEPEQKEQIVQGDGYADGAVVYSGSVYISSGMMVTHPRTGERVAIGPYAEARGYGHVLNKSIQCTIRKKGNGYVATATCGGAVVASATLSSEAELRNAIGLIQAYS